MRQKQTQKAHRRLAPSSPGHLPFSLQLSHSPYVCFIKHPDQAARWVGASSHTPEGCRFDPGQGTYLGCCSIPGGALTGDRKNRCFSHIDVFLSRFLSLKKKSIKTHPLVMIKTIRSNRKYYISSSWKITFTPFFCHFL